MTKEELQEIADTYGLYTEQDVKNRVSCELLSIGTRNEELLKENAELKEVHESDKRSLALIAKKGADFEKAYNEAEELLDKQIEATYKLFEENKELKELVEKYRQAVDKCLHITFMGGGCEANTIGQYATLVDGYLTDVEGLAKWKN